MATPTDRYRRPVPQQRRGDSLSGAGLVLAALLAVAFGVGVVIAGYAWLAWPKAEPPEISAAVTSATGRSDLRGAVPTAPVDDGAWTDADIGGCSKEAGAAAEVAKRRRLAAVSADRVGLGGPDPAMVERSTYLLCGATRKPLHLCQPYWRDWFIKAIKAHVKEFKDVSTQSYWTRVAVAERARRETGAAWQSLSDDLDQTTRDVAKTHAEIVAAFQALIKDGIISRDDFGVVLGFGIPSDIKAMMGEARPLRERCG